jgi:uncharacterized protein YukE
MGQGRGALSRAAVLVGEARRDLDRLTREVTAHVDAAQAQWCGQGGAAFVALGLAWSERQAVIVSALDGFEASLRATEHDNLATDAAQAADLGRTRQRLG